MFFFLIGELKELTWNKNTTLSIITVCRHTHAYTYDVVFPRIQKTKSQNIATQRYCGLHSHGFSGWMRSGCFHRGQWYQVGNYRQKMEAHSSPEAEGKGGLIFSSFLIQTLFFLMTNSHTILAKNREAWGSSRWCRVYQERTLETCNPGADLERGIQTGHGGHCKWSTMPLQLHRSQIQSKYRHLCIKKHHFGVYSPSSDFFFHAQFTEASSPVPLSMQLQAFSLLCAWENILYYY